LLQVLLSAGCRVLFRNAPAQVRCGNANRCVRKVAEEVRPAQRMRLLHG
jgi:hypothetical protein